MECGADGAGEAADLVVQGALHAATFNSSFRKNGVSDELPRLGLFYLIALWYFPGGAGE